MGAPKGTIPHNAGKGQGWVDPRGYRIASRTVNGKRQQVREHRSVMESILGRPLEPWEIVHHKDGNPLNNSPSNLAVMTFGEHTTEHHRGGRKSLETRRSMEAFANMREELKRVRSMNAELLAALRECADSLPVAADCPRINTNIVNYTDREWDRLVRATINASAAIAKATGADK